MPHQQGLHTSVKSKEMKTCGPRGHPLSELVPAAELQPVSVGPRGSTQATATPAVSPRDISLLGHLSPPSSWNLTVCCQLHSSHSVPPSWQAGDGVNPRLCWRSTHHYCVQGWGPYSHSFLKQVFSPRHALPLCKSSLQFTYPTSFILDHASNRTIKSSGLLFLGDLLRRISPFLLMGANTLLSMAPRSAGSAWSSSSDECTAGLSHAALFDFHFKNTCAEKWFPKASGGKQNRKPKHMQMAFRARAAPANFCNWCTLKIFT